MAQKIRAVIVLNNKYMHSPLLTALGWLVCSQFNVGFAATLKVCYDQWAPMTMFPADSSTERGVVIDMLEHIYTAEGYDIQYYEVPLARGLDMVAEGLCDMLPEYLYSERSAQAFEYAQQETFSYPSAFVVRKEDTWRYEGVESLRGRRIATGPGWDYSSMSAGYQAYIDDPRNVDFVEVIAGNDDVVNRIFEMISENRVDVYVDNKLVLQHVLNQMNLSEELSIVQPGLENNLVEKPIFSMRIPEAERQELIRIWNEGRLSLKGEMEDKILRKYNVKIE